jgi:acetyl-CoA/propionyl-CoA carboxylase carboxyl transferase subunit
MGAETAVGVLHRKVLAATAESEREAARARLIEEHQRLAGGVGRALALGLVDEVIPTAGTSARLAQAIAAAPAGRGHHANIPL